MCHKFDDENNQYDSNINDINVVTKKYREDDTNQQEVTNATENSPSSSAGP